VPLGGDISTVEGTSPSGIFGGGMLKKVASFSGLESESMYDMNDVDNGNSRDSLGVDIGIVGRQHSYDDKAVSNKTKSKRSYLMKESFVEEYNALRLEHVTRFIRKMLRSQKQVRQIEEFAKAYLAANKRRITRKELIDGVSDRVDKDTLTRYCNDENIK
jgi:hypothetical protein